MVGIALKTAVQGEALQQTKAVSNRRNTGQRGWSQHAWKGEWTCAHLVGAKTGVISLSGQMYFMMTTMVTYQVPITLSALQWSTTSWMWLSFKKAVFCFVFLKLRDKKVTEWSYLAYFWKPISLGMERGRITRTAVTTMVNLRSVYQKPPVLPAAWVTAAITEIGNRHLKNTNQTEGDG